MGWRFRKIINLCCGFRTTISRSGAGISWGFPGFRIGKSARGGMRISVGIPGTGFYFTKNIDNLLKPPPAAPENGDTFTSNSSSQERRLGIKEWKDLK